MKDDCSAAQLLHAFSGEFKVSSTCLSQLAIIIVKQTQQGVNKRLTCFSWLDFSVFFFCLFVFCSFLVSKMFIIIGILSNLHSNLDTNETTREDL